MSVGGRGKIDFIGEQRIKGEEDEDGCTAGKEKDGKCLSEKRK